MHMLVDNNCKTVNPSGKTVKLFTKRVVQTDYLSSYSYMIGTAAKLEEKKSAAAR
jgi:hypothetical protein